MKKIKNKMRFIRTFIVFLSMMGLYSNVLSCPQVSPEKLRELIKSDSCVFIIDVRHPMEFSKKHIKNANLIPLDIFGYIYLSGLKNRTVVVYSERGKRGEVACKKLHEMGILQTFNLEGGIDSWIKKGFPVIRGYK
jgi:rhodanese-related sulfurtransferase